MEFDVCLTRCRQRPSAEEVLSHKALSKFHNAKTETYGRLIKLPCTIDSFRFKKLIFGAVKDRGKFRAVDYRGAIYRHVIEKINLARQRGIVKQKKKTVVKKQLSVQ